MKIELISSGLVGVILAWAVWETLLSAAIFAGVIGVVSIILGMILKK